MYIHIITYIKSPKTRLETPEPKRLILWSRVSAVGFGVEGTKRSRHRGSEYSGPNPPQFICGLLFEGGAVEFRARI